MKEFNKNGQQVGANWWKAHLAPSVEVDTLTFEDLYPFWGLDPKLMVGSDLIQGSSDPLDLLVDQEEKKLEDLFFSETY